VALAARDVAAAPAARRSGHKQSTDVTFLADAARAGAKVLVGAYAERLLLEPAAPGGPGKLGGGRGHAARSAGATSLQPNLH
jgi:hypothetical protein